MKSFISALLMCAAAMSAPAMAAGKSATFQATFTVLESCAIESNPSQPTVRCQFASPSSVAPEPAAAMAAAPQQISAPQQVSADSAQAQPAAKVWTVTF